MDLPCLPPSKTYPLKELTRSQAFNAPYGVAMPVRIIRLDLFPRTPAHVPNVQLVSSTSSSRLRMSSSTRMLGLMVRICSSLLLPPPPFSFHTHALLISASYGPYLQKRSVSDHFSAPHWYPVLICMDPRAPAMMFTASFLLSLSPTPHSQHSIRRNHLKPKLLHTLPLHRNLHECMAKI